MTSELDSGFGVELEAGEAGSCPAEIWEKWGECVHTQRLAASLPLLPALCLP